MTQTGPFRLPAGGRLIDRAWHATLRALRGLTGRANDDDAGNLGTAPA